MSLFGVVNIDCYRLSFLLGGFIYFDIWKVCYSEVIDQSQVEGK